MWLSPEHAAGDLSRRLIEVQDKIKEEKEKQRMLSEAGIVRATTWWKAGKYLYLLYPSSVLAKRRREYVGADTEKINAALAAIERAKEFDASKRVEQDLHHQLAEANRYVQLAHSMIRDSVSPRPNW